MRTGVGLVFICAGAILAFAVTASTSVFNLHTAGWVIMLVGALGLAIPRRTYGWLGSRMLVRHTRAYPGQGRVEEIAVPPYIARNPGTSRISAGLPPQSPLLSDDPADRPPRGPGETEVIEDLYEQQD